MINRSNIQAELMNRLESLGWTLYKVAKNFAQIRAEIDGVVSPVVRYHTSVGKAMENPAKSKLETIEDIVKAMNGELKIEWHLDPDTKDPDTKRQKTHFEIKFFVEDKFNGLTYSGDFAGALKIALNYHHPCLRRKAEIWLDSQQLCSSDQIIQVYQDQQAKWEQVESAKSGSYAVITNMPFIMPVSLEGITNEYQSK